VSFWVIDFDWFLMDLIGIDRIFRIFTVLEFIGVLLIQRS